MYDAIRNHAVLNVWCNPTQDNQIILKAARVSRPGGEYISMIYMDRVLKMPLADRRFHVYHVGDATPKALGLLNTVGMTGWLKFDETVTSTDLFCDIYTEDGLHVPLHRTYYRVTTPGSLIFAVDVRSLSDNKLVAGRAYLRLYTNAWYENEGRGLAVRTKAKGLTIQSSAELVAIRNEVTQLQAKPGHVFCFVNGVLRETISARTAVVGDTVEYEYDASVKRIVDLKISDLHTFTSSLDALYKYILHYPGRGEDVIDYVDDVDVYVLYKSEETRYKGRMLPRNLKTTLRNITHKDYALSVPATLQIADALLPDLGNEMLSAMDLTVRLYIRNGGMIRPLIKEASRIFELYKLEDEQVVRALQGVDSTVPFWRADELEANGYTGVMRSRTMALDETLVEDCYGYNGITKVLADTPSKVAQPRALVDLQPLHRESSTVFEYDVSGKLTGWSVHEVGATHPVAATTALAEVYAGRGGRDLKPVYGENFLPIPLDRSWRLYMCHVVDGLPDRHWEDVTDSGLYTVTNNTIVWGNQVTGQYLMLRSDERFLCYSFQMQAIGGLVYFDLTEQTPEGLRPLEVPLGDIDLWVNGMSLVRDIGFIYQHPRVTVVDKGCLLQPAGSSVQSITVRAYGFSDAELQGKKVEDSGFIVHGMLSDNKRYDIRDDKVLRITVGGALKHRDDVLFSEEHSGVSVVNAINGQPYQVKEVVVPVNDWTKTETYLFRAQALERDQAVRDYMTQFYPEPVRDAVSSIVSRYTVFSPFLSRIINDLASGLFDHSSIEAELTDNEVLSLCEPYMDWMAFDPINPDLAYNHNFVLIHPHQLNRTIELDMYQYAFVSRVVKLFAKGLVELSNHLLIKEP